MRDLILARVLQGLLVLAGATVLVFLVVRIIPGDPVRLMGPLATDENLRRLRLEWGLDRPVPLQFLKFLGDAAHGEFGTSVFMKRPVLALVAERLPLTLALATFAMLFALLLALPLGATAALWRDSWWDRLAMTLAVALQSMPNYWLGFVLLFLVAVQWRLLPATEFVDARSLVLPGVSLGLGLVPALTRASRTILVDILGQPFVAMLHLRGVPRRVILLQHAFRNMAIPLLTLLAVQLGYLLGGAVVIEFVFNFPGIGLLLLNAVLRRDYPLVQGIALFMSATFVLLNLLADLSYGLLDPRLRRAESRVGE